SHSTEEERMRHTLLLFMATLAVVAAYNAPAAARRYASVATMTNSGINSSSFCTNNGQILVVLQCRGAGSNGNCSLGQTYISGGPGTFRLPPGNAHVPQGCYSTHGFANTTVAGTAAAVSTIWYDQ